MITETGKNLDVVIVPYISQQWETYAAWYSAMKNLPDAKFFIGYIRTDEIPFEIFQWAKRLKVNIRGFNMISANNTINKISVLRNLMEEKTIGERVLLMEPLEMVIDVLSSEMASVLDQGVTVSELDKIIEKQLLNQECEINQTHPIFNLKKEAKETKDLHPLISYKKGCGRWIDKLKGCPFSSAASFVSEDMTINENRIVELWKKMVATYSAVF